jgi:hypothetical protein
MIRNISKHSLENKEILNQIFKMRKAVYLEQGITGNIRLGEEKAINMNTWLGYYCSVINRDWIYEWFSGTINMRGNFSPKDITLILKNYIPELTTKNVVQALSVFKKIAEKRAKDKVDSSRLYPLPDCKYDEIAKKVWIKMGKPAFRKRIIHGIKWGKGNFRTTGYGMRKVILERTLGCGIREGRVVIICPDDNTWVPSNFKMARIRFREEK